MAEITIKGCNFFITVPDKKDKEILSFLVVLTNSHVTMLEYKLAFVVLGLVSSKLSSLKPALPQNG